MSANENEIDTFYPANTAEWRNWLKTNHRSKSAVWLIFYKKSTQIPTISWSQAVDEALCFGWIDSVKKTVDKDSYRQFFTPRKEQSTWSKINKDKVADLIAQKRMTPAGLKCIEIAKENGTWTILDEVEALVIPVDLKAALQKEKDTMEFFGSLSKSNKKILLYWVMSAKRTETRQKRIDEIVVNARENRKPAQFR